MKSKKDIISFCLAWILVAGSLIALPFASGTKKEDIRIDVAVFITGHGAPEGKEKESDDEYPVVYVGSILAVVAVAGCVVVYRKKQAADAVKCPGCGCETQYTEEEDDYYCWECEEYIGDMEEMGW